MRLVIALAALTLGVGAAQAQALTPMVGRVSSATDMFSIRVQPFNPYGKRMRMEVKVYDHRFRQVRALISPWRFGIGANQKRNVHVKVPFNGQNKRRVRVCVEARPFTKTTQRVRTRVCGKFIATRY